MDNMKISVVMPVHNAQSTIADVIRAYNEQSYPYHELIIINDGSNDATPDILKVLKKEYKFVLLTNQSRRGAAVSRNIGNNVATGDIIAVADADYPLADRLECINEFFTQTDADVFYSAYDVMDSKNLFYRQRVPLVQWNFESKCTISHPTVAYKRQCAIDHQYHELSPETDLYEFVLLDMYRAGKKFGCAGNSLVCKIEGDSVRDKTTAGKLKAGMYKSYGIEV